MSRAPAIDRVGHAVERAVGGLSVLLAADFGIEWVSESLATVLQRDDLIGLNAVELVHPDVALVADAADFHGSAPEQRFTEADFRPRTARVRLATASGDFVLVEVVLFNLLHDPDVEGILATGHLTSGDETLADAIDMIGSQAPLDEVLALIEDFIEESVSNCRCQVVWWKGADLQTGPRAEIDPDVRNLLPDLRRTQETLTVATTDAASEVREISLLPITSPSGTAALGAMVIANSSDVLLPTGPHQPLHQDRRLASLAIVYSHTDASTKWDERHDPMSGLLNRAGLAEARSGVERGAMMVFRIASAADVGDDELAERLVAKTAGCLTAEVRPGDVVARVDRLDVAVLAPELVEAESLAHVSERLRRALENAVRDDGGVPRVGVATADGITEQVSMLRRAIECLDEGFC